MTVTLLGGGVAVLLVAGTIYYLHTRKATPAVELVVSTSGADAGPQGSTATARLLSPYRSDYAEVIELYCKCAMLHIVAALQFE